MKNLSSSNFKKLVRALNQEEVIAYPTESVFSLGCDPSSELAIQKLLKLKKRSWEKGLILVAANYGQLKDYINHSMIDSILQKQMLSTWPGRFTWVVPANPEISFWITGKNKKTVAIRISAFEPIRILCLEFGKPIISTSANISGSNPIRTFSEVKKQFGKNIPILEFDVEGYIKTSEIRNIISKELIRKG